MAATGEKENKERMKNETKEDFSRRMNNKDGWKECAKRKTVARRSCDVEKRPLNESNFTV